MAFHRQICWRSAVKSVGVAPSDVLASHRCVSADLAGTAMSQKTWMRTQTEVSTMQPSLREEFVRAPALVQSGASEWASGLCLVLVSFGASSPSHSSQNRSLGSHSPSSDPESAPDPMVGSDPALDPLQVLMLWFYPSRVHCV